MSVTCHGLSREQEPLLKIFLKCSCQNIFVGNFDPRKLIKLKIIVGIFFS